MTEYNKMSYTSVPASPARTSKTNRSRYTSFELSVTSQPVSPINPRKSFHYQTKKSLGHQKKQEDKLAYDIDNFIQYILKKKEENKNIQSVTQQLKNKVEDQKRSVEQKNREMLQIQNNLTEIQVKNNQSFCQYQKQVTEIESETSLIVAKTFQIEDELMRVKEQQEKKMYLQALLAALVVDFQIKQEEIVAKINHFHQQTKNSIEKQHSHREKIAFSESKQKDIQKKKEQINILKRLNLSSRIIFKDLYSITTEQLKPTSRSEQSIYTLTNNIEQKMEIIKSGLKQCQQSARFMKRMENCNIRKMEEEEKESVEDDEDLIFDIYLDELSRMQSIGKLKIDEQKETKKYHDLLSQGQLDEIREKNTQVLYYLKKLQTEFKKKSVVISNLEKQLEEIVNKKTENK